jgi:hypothetical protein
MSTLKPRPSDNISAVSLTTDETPSRRNSPNYSRSASSVKFSILSGLPTPSSLLTVNFRQPSHEFTFDADMNFISYPLVLTPLV